MADTHEHRGSAPGGRGRLSMRRDRRRWSLRARAASFRDAVRGGGHLLLDEPHAQVHAGLAIVAAAMGVWLGIAAWQWAAVALAIGLVLTAEALNTALERLADAAHPEEHPLVGRAKDMAAGGVLLASLAALGVGVAVFGPALWDAVMK